MSTDGFRTVSLKWGWKSGLGQIKKLSNRLGSINTDIIGCFGSRRMERVIGGGGLGGPKTGSKKSKKSPTLKRSLARVPFSGLEKGNRGLCILKSGDNNSCPTPKQPRAKIHGSMRNITSRLRKEDPKPPICDDLPKRWVACECNSGVLLQLLWGVAKSLFPGLAHGGVRTRSHFCR